MAAGDPHRLLAAIDIGTSSFKLLLAHAQSHRFLPIDRLSSPVLLGRDLAGASLSSDAICRSIAALRSFSLLLSSHDPLPLIRLVATSALRRASNSSQLLTLAFSQLGFQIEIISGDDEARLIYLGILQFLPVYHKLVLAVDIGGGSTEFGLGLKGEVLFSVSLDLGHVTLTESFVKSKDLAGLRRHVRTALDASGLVEKVGELGFEVAVGSSGTVKSIEKAISMLGGLDFGRRWRFGRDELEGLVEKLCGDFDVLGLEGVRRLGFSRRRAEFVMAGAVLLMEIFEVLGIKEMEVSGYALGEGVIAEMMMKENGLDLGFDLEVNARWRSVMGLAVRFDGENRMKSSVECVGIAKGVFSGITKWGVNLDHKDFEYLEAAILLHNIGRVVGKKGYHKFSYQIIKNGGHLHGYSNEEIEFIALLARFHRKKFPKCQHASLQDLPMEMKEKVRVLCIIIRLSLGLRQSQFVDSQGLEIVHSPEGFRLVLRGKEHLLNQCGSENFEADLRPELNHFEEVFHQKISIIIR